jgi:hypothetical protein
MNDILESVGYISCFLKKKALLLLFFASLIIHAPQNKKKTGAHTPPQDNS